MAKWVVGASVVVGSQGDMPATIVEVRPGNLRCRLEDGRILWIPEGEVRLRTRRSDRKEPANAPTPQVDAPFAAPQANPYEAPRGAPVFQDAERDLRWLLFSFQGRISRSEFWKGTLISWSVLVLLMVAAGLVAYRFASEPYEEFLAGVGVGLLLGFLLLLIPIAWIGLALQVKRWHDRDKSGAWVFIQFIPYVGAIWAFVETGCLRGTPGPNRFGPDPLRSF